MELDKTFESRDEINRQIVAVLDEAGRTWGIKVLRYEIKNLTPPEAILRSMQAQITAEREKRALIAKSEGQRQQEINLADGDKQAAILKSEGEKQAAINKAQGEATAIRLIAEATAAARARGGRGDRQGGRHERGQPEGGRAVHRCVRQPRQDQQHADRAEQCIGCRGAGGIGHDRDGEDQTRQHRCALSSYFSRAFTVLAVSSAPARNRPAVLSVPDAVDRAAAQECRPWSRQLQAARRRSRYR